MPQNVLEHVVAHVLIVDSSQAINMLTQYGSRVHNATAAVLLNHVVLHDDDAVLVQAERGLCLAETQSSPVSLPTRHWQDMSKD